MTTPSLPDILKEILSHKRAEVAARAEKTSLKTLKNRCADKAPTRDFVGAIQTKINQKQPAIIAEIKRASPSKGVICTDFNPTEIARHYAASGAACLSILTDEQFFQGHDNDLRQARAACELPVLRKDFIVDSYQVYEACALGADCILLIVNCLTDQALQDFHTLAVELGMAVLVESHTAQELTRALQLATPLVGINNRDLHTFQTDLNTTRRLCPMIPNNRIIVSESGISSQENINQLMAEGVCTFLVGEALMREVVSQRTIDSSPSIFSNSGHPKK